MKASIQNSVFQEVYYKFDQFIRVKGYKTGGGKMYQSAVRDLLLFSEKSGLVELYELNNKHLDRYYVHLINRPNKRGGTLSQSSINHHLFALRLFFDFLLDDRYLDNTVKLPSFLRNNRLERDSLTIIEITHLFDVCESHIERSILALAYGCGLRRTEIQDLNISDVDFKEEYLVVVEGKNSKRREVAISKSMLEHLRSYVIEERTNLIKGNHLPKAFLINKFGGRMLGQTVYERFKDILSRSIYPGINQKNITLHSLRHSIAEHMADNGADIEFIKDFLGHSQIDTAQLYAIKQRLKNNSKP